MTTWIKEVDELASQLNDGRVYDRDLPELNGQSVDLKLVLLAKQIQMINPRINVMPMAAVDSVILTGMAETREQARKDVQGGGVYLNNERVGDLQASVTRDQLLFGRHLLLRKGKRNYLVVTVK